jgi:putative transposase
MSDLGVTKSHSRPHVSEDNPYSESQFKTLKYCPEFPGRFGSIQDARTFCQEFFRWYNNEHRHWGIGLMAPEAVHHGRAEKITQMRENVLSSAYGQNPERFVSGMPKPPCLQKEVWINKPKPGNGAVAAAPPEGGRLDTDNRNLVFQPNVSQNC